MSTAEYSKKMKAYKLAERAEKTLLADAKLTANQYWSRINSEAANMAESGCFFSYFKELGYEMHREEMEDGPTAPKYRR